MTMIYHYIEISSVYLQEIAIYRVIKAIFRTDITISRDNDLSSVGRNIPGNNRPSSAYISRYPVAIFLQ